MERRPGEYTIYPVTKKAFEKWSKNNPDVNLGVQFTEESLTYCIMHRPHDGAAAKVTTSIIESVKSLMQILKKK
jgi:hypothetical protein